MKKVCVMLMMAALVAAGQAALIVDYNGPDSNLDAAVADVQTTGGDTWTFSDTTPLLSAATGQNTTVYGGVITTWDVSQEYNPKLRFLTSTGADTALQIQVNPALPADTSEKAVLLWNQADFLNGAASETVAFEAGSSLSVNLTSLTSSTRDHRFVVNQGGTYYVSEDALLTKTTGVYEIDPSATNWAALNTSDYSWDTFSALTLDDVQGVGLYSDMTRVGNQTILKFDDFQASTVPEPATMALLGLGGLLLRRKK